MLRPAFHDTGTFEKEENSGGMNGSIILELDRPENSGLLSVKHPRTWLYFREHILLVVKDLKIPLFLTIHISKSFWRNHGCFQVACQAWWGVHQTTLLPRMRNA
ncbi:uncharacterized protein [Aristolochia californica]|uniref:uncharacterized protein n=1 Tax=Aristolochia californica TaxID=171875 RepID=UPI0035E2A200